MPYHAIHTYPFFVLLTAYLQLVDGSRLPKLFLCSTVHTYLHYKYPFNISMFNLTVLEAEIVDFCFCCYLGYVCDGYILM